MNKKEDFKRFIKDKPYLVNYIQNGSMSWQKFYELFDLYGDNTEVWNKYSDTRNTNLNDQITKLSDLVKNVNLDSIKGHINTAQKALDLVSELTTKNATDALNTVTNLTKGPTTPRPLNKFFED